MMRAEERAADFRNRLASGARLVGTFIKAPTTATVEIIGDAGFDFLVIDQEHAPLDRLSIDLAVLAAAAADIAPLVRVATMGDILGVLDSGAAGLVVPHVNSADKARQVVAACRYRPGSRGFSGSPRAGRYGAVPLWELLAAADQRISLIVQIEDAEALDDLEGIMATEGVDGVFIGRADLAVSMGLGSMDAPELRAAVTRICAAAKTAGKPVAVAVGSEKEAKWLAEEGASAFVYLSDLGFLRSAAVSTLAGLDRLLDRKTETAR